MADRLRRQSDEILALWEQRVRASVPPARALDKPTLRNSIPSVLASLADTLENIDTISAPKIEVSRIHGQTRAGQPRYSISEVIFEYRLLRRTIFDVLAPPGAPLMDPLARNAIIDLIEVGIAEAASAFADLQYQYHLREGFISALTHDLRNPLTVAKAGAELIRKEPEKIETNRILGAKIAATIDRTEHMIQDLLDSNLVQAGGTLPLKFEESELRAVINMTLEELKLAVGDRFIFDSGGAAIFGHWDVKYLKRAIENVAMNAVKYGDPGAPILVTLTQSNSKVTISIHNEGPVLAPVDLESIFQPFQRLPRASADQKLGWGIGLSLVKGVCDAHGGSVAAHSQQTTGTTFTIDLPIDARPTAKKAA
ncbi:MAG: ATP-binding protein [Bdellovibrionota bacterium]